MSLGSFARDPPEVCLKKDTEKLSKFINFSTGKVKFGIKKPDFKQFCTLCPFPGLNLDESGKLIDIRPVIIVNLTSPSLKPFIGGREDLTYVNQVGKLVKKQAFYLSTGMNSDMRGTWLPFDGVSIMETPLGLKTRFEKDNFDGRFGGLFGRMMTKKSEHVFQNLSLVSEILGGGVWGDPERIKKHFEEKYKEYEKLKTNPKYTCIDRLIDPPYLSWQTPKIFEFITDCEGFNLSTGLDWKNLPNARALHDNEKLVRRAGGDEVIAYKYEYASQINKCINGNNSVQVKFNADELYLDGDIQIPEYKKLFE